MFLFLLILYSEITSSYHRWRYRSSRAFIHRRQIVEHRQPVCCHHILCLWWVSRRRSKVIDFIMVMVILKMMVYFSVICHGFEVVMVPVGSLLRRGWRIWPLPQMQIPPYCGQFQGHFVIFNPLFYVKTRTKPYFGIPLFIRLWGHFRKFTPILPYFKDKTRLRNFVSPVFSFPFSWPLFINFEDTCAPLFSIFRGIFCPRTLLEIDPFFRDFGNGHAVRKSHWVTPPGWWCVCLLSFSQVLCPWFYHSLEECVLQH